MGRGVKMDRVKAGGGGGRGRRSSGMKTGRSGWRKEKRGGEGGGGRKRKWKRVGRGEKIKRNANGVW